MKAHFSRKDYDFFSEHLERYNLNEEQIYTMVCDSYINPDNFLRFVDAITTGNYYHVDFIVVTGEHDSFPLIVSSKNRYTV